CMTEIWEKYDTVAIPDDGYEIEKVMQDLKGVTISLIGEYYRMTVSFSFVDCLKISDEGRRIRTLNEIEGIQEYRETFMGNPLYTVENSDFYNWLIAESVGFGSDVIQYSILTEDNIIDIL